jgi:hypothetical protein
MPSDKLLSAPSPVELIVKVVAALATGSRCLRTFAFARKMIKRETRQRAHVTATKRFARGLRGIFFNLLFLFSEDADAAEK